MSWLKLCFRFRLHFLPHTANQEGTNCGGSRCALLPLKAGQRAGWHFDRAVGLAVPVLFRPLVLCIGCLRFLGVRGGCGNSWYCGGREKSARALTANLQVSFLQGKCLSLLSEHMLSVQGQGNTPGVLGTLTHPGRLSAAAWG